MLNWLLVFVPIAVGLHYLRPEAHTWIFVTAASRSFLSLDGWEGHRHIAEKTGEGIGGLLNATFGNAAEMIIAIMAMQRGLHDVVKASLTGSDHRQYSSRHGCCRGRRRAEVQDPGIQCLAARIQATMLSLAAVALIVPAAFHYLTGPAGVIKEFDLSFDISIVLLITYALSLLFSSHTTTDVFGDLRGGGRSRRGKHSAWPMGKSIAVLAVATAMIAWISEMLVASVEVAAHEFGCLQSSSASLWWQSSATPPSTARL